MRGNRNSLRTRALVKLRSLRVESLEARALLNGGSAFSYGAIHPNAATLFGPPAYAATGKSISTMVQGVTLTLPTDATEGVGTVAGTATIPTNPSSNVTVTLTSSDTARLTVPATVIIPVGQKSIGFLVTIIDDTLLNGPAAVTVFASTATYGNTSSIITVHDNETATLGVTLPASGWEGQTLAGTVTLSGTMASATVVLLTSSDTSELTLPASVTIPIGSTSGSFTAALVANGLHTGPKAVTVTASASGLANATAATTVNDSDLDHFTFTTLAANWPAGVPFSVTAKACDILNNPIAVYNGTATLSASGQSGSLAITPTSVTFASGVWTGSVLVDRVDPSATLRATSGTGATGTSNAVNFYNPLQVASISPAAGATLGPQGTCTLDVTFFRPFTASSVTTGSLVLSGIAGATVTAATVLNSNTTARFTLFIPMDGTLTATIPSGGVTDQNGNPGIAFSASYVANIVANVVTAAFPVPLTAKNPLGSLVYEGSTTGVVNVSTDTDNFTIALGSGQTLTACVVPAAALQPFVTITGPTGSALGSATAAAAGKQAVLQIVPVNTAGTYTVTVGSASGTMGAYTLQLDLNAALEAESHDGAANNTFATAQSLQSAFATLGGTAQRAAVLGTTDAASTPDDYSVPLSVGQSLTLGLASLAADTATLSLYDSGQNLLASGAATAANLNRVINNFVAPATGTYYVGIAGAGAAYNLVVTRNADFDTEPNDSLATAQNINGRQGVLGYLPTFTQPGDWYSFNVSTPGGVLNLATSTPADGSGQFANTLSPHVELNDPSGTLVAGGTVGADGRNETISYTPSVAGNYRVRVTAKNSTRGEYYLAFQRSPGPVVATAASATLSYPGSAIATLAVLGADDTGEATLTYTWTAVTLPSGATAPTFSVNGTNAAKNASVAFHANGTYLLQVTIRDPAGLTATSSTSVSVSVPAGGTGSGRTWSGGTDNHLATAANWSGGVAPQMGDTLILSASANAAFVNDLPTATILRGIVVPGFVVSISGNSLTTDFGGLTVSVAAGATLQLGVGITGPGGLRQDGAGQLLLSPSSRVSGGVAVAAGTVVASSPTSLASGSSFSVDSDGALVLMGGDVTPLQTIVSSGAASASAAMRRKTAFGATLELPK